MRLLERYKQWGYPQEPISLPTVIRVNTLKADEKQLITRLKRRGAKLHKIPYLEHAYTFDADFSAGSTQEYLLGYYYMQEAASQLPVHILKPEGVVIDLCAAPGSKTTQLSQYMNNKGVIIACDIHNKRLEKLNNNIERMGCTNVIVQHKDAQFISDYKIEADGILLDAPCSGNFCVEKNWLQQRSEEDFVHMQKTQRKLLKAAVRVLKKGGRLVYSTCSLEKEENEDVVEWALEHVQGLRLLPIDINTGTPGLTQQTKHCLRMWPKQQGTQGFFVALFDKIY